MPLNNKPQHKSGNLSKIPGKRHKIIGENQDKKPRNSFKALHNNNRDEEGKQSKMIGFIKK